MSLFKPAHYVRQERKSWILRPFQALSLSNSTLQTWVQASNGRGGDVGAARSSVAGSLPAACFQTASSEYMSQAGWRRGLLQL